jgi:hypothetical protein
MVGKVRSFGTLIWRVANGSAAREEFFVCSTWVKYIDGRFVVGLPGGVIGDRELMA